MGHTVARLMESIEERGWKGRLVRIEHLSDLRAAIQSRREAGLFDETLYNEWFSWFSFEPPEELPAARSIIVVSVPVPQTRITLRWRGRQMPVVVPPTYAGYRRTTEDVRAALAALLAPDAYSVARTALPLKTLAVCSGLVDYGRNNITYVAGGGSFHQLVAAFTDLPCHEDPWRGPAVAQRCESCSACLKNCPTGAIDTSRFLLRAERCLTYHNEAARDFPAWIDPSWHRCLLGCMRCQDVCPLNRNVIGQFDDRTDFSEEEARLLVGGTPTEDLPSETAAKLLTLELNEDHRLLSRNLSLLMTRADRSPDTSRTPRE